MIKTSALFPYFDVALISYEQGICKPSPEMYQRMIELLGVVPEECLYVGDGGSRELYGARDAGMKAVQCTWFADRAYEPHIPCPPLDEFEHVSHQMDVLDFPDFYPCANASGMDGDVIGVLAGVDKPFLKGFVVLALDVDVLGRQ